MACGFVNAQNLKFGKVSLDEVTDNVYEQDTSASAAILYKYRDTYFDHDHPDGFIIVTEVHERIKILNKEGLDYATKKIRLYKSNSTKERITGLKGYTYNAEGSKLKTEKLKKSAVFKNEITDHWNETTFTMPNAGVGSVVEWTYKISSPFWKIDDLIIQEDIPTRHYHAKIQTLTYFNFTRIAKGGFSVTPREYSEPRTLSISFEQSTNSALTQATKTSTIQTMENVSEYELRDIPALKEEAYVDNIDNYRFLITYELKSTEFPKSGLKTFSTTWEEVVKTINKSKYFGEQLNKKRYFKDDLERIKSNSNGELDLVRNVFDFVKGKMNWNGRYSKYTDLGVQKAYKDNTGNVSEINLMLVAMLREAGIKTSPVLVSTRKHGIPAFPTIEGFNYVIACAEVNGQEILMDATEKQSIPGILPERTLNWEGTLVRNDGGFRKINLYPKQLSQRNTLLSATISDDGSVEGTHSSSYTNLEALEYRNKLKDVNKDEYVEAIVNTYQFDDVVDFNLENMSDLDKPVKESFSFEVDEGTDLVGTEIYFSPLLYLAMDENPFKLEERNYPVNFVHPFNIRKIVNIRIPEGYEVTSMPEPVRMSLPDNMGTYLFNISKVEGGLNIMCNFKINQPVIPSFKYNELKEFYNLRVKKETEKVVLTKL